MWKSPTATKIQKSKQYGKLNVNIDVWRRKTKENIKLVFTQKILLVLLPYYITKQTSQIIFLHLNFEIVLF